MAEEPDRYKYRQVGIKERLVQEFESSRVQESSEIQKFRDFEG
jgi:hypothetical protein